MTKHEKLHKNPIQIMIRAILSDKSRQNSFEFKRHGLGKFALTFLGKCVLLTIFLFQIAYRHYGIVFIPLISCFLVSIINNNMRYENEAFDFLISNCEKVEDAEGKEVKDGQD